MSAVTIAAAREIRLQRAAAKLQAMETVRLDDYQGVALGVESAWPAHIEWLLDQALEATFPASDPISVSAP